MTEGAIETLIPAQVDKLLVPNKKDFREADKLELDILAHSIGVEALQLAKEGGKIYCLAIGSTTSKFALELGDRVIEIGVLEPQGNPAVRINFKAFKYLSKNTAKKTSDEEDLRPYLETEKTSLTKEKLGFLRFVGSFVLAINQNCKIFIRPSSLRRERIYTKFLNPKHHPNICFLPASQNDTKTKQTSS